jgi:hypothetical protein
MINKYKTFVRLLIIIACFSGILMNMIISSKNSSVPVLGAFNSFLYFTIQSNLLVLIWFINAVWCESTKRSNFLMKPIYKGAITSYITLTFLVFFFILEPTYHPQGLHLVSSILMHYVVPFAVIIDWVLYEPRKSYHYKFLIYWVIYPISYASLGVILSLLIQKSLYPFFNVTELGWLIVPYILMLAFVFLIIGATYITFNRLLNNHKNV